MCCCWQLVRQLRQSLLERTLDTRSVSITPPPPSPPPPPTPPPPLLHPHKQKREQIYSLRNSYVTNSYPFMTWLSLFEVKHFKQTSAFDFHHKESSWINFEPPKGWPWAGSGRLGTSEILSVRAGGIVHALLGYLSIRVSVSGITGIPS